MCLKTYIILVNIVIKNSNLRSDFIVLQKYKMFILGIELS